jgi:AmmeMemoRadiSam system protein A
MSGDMTGEYDGGVSYAAIIFGDIKSITEREEKKPSIDNKVISDEEEKTLLGLARFVLNSFVSSGVTNYPGAKPGGFTITDRMKQRLGAFVTLNKSDQLRGCIGYITGRKMLYEAVIDNTVNAAASDPRFSPVTKEELKDIDIEISVITPLIKVESIDEIQIGRDGLYLVNGNNTGVFLPQVPLEWNWDRKTYLEELGLKAGLTREAYRDKATILYRFSAQVFGEK